MSLSALRELVARVNDILCASSLLVWDSRTMMPAGGASSRAEQIASLTRIARDMLAGSQMAHALDGAERDVATHAASTRERREVEQIRAAAELHRRIDPAIIQRRSLLRGLANAAWVEARTKSDFSLFLPRLEQTIDAARDYADAIGYCAHPYDALVGLYEPGETLASLCALFSTLKSGLKPILAVRMASPAARRDFLSHAYPPAEQISMARHFAGVLGYEFGRGRLDLSVHPFEISFTRQDVRITTRAREDYLPPALFGAMHETGHALYEQNVAPEYSRSVFATDLIGLYAVGGTSFGAHESQSRLWENHVGRSLAFWNVHFPSLARAFPTQLADVDASAFHAAVTQPSPGFIRTDADELTYDFHVMLRVECEAALIDGSLQARDLPGWWAQAMQENLGITPPDDAQGCLQDIHWSSGMIGSFCSYTIGNVMAAQLFASAQAQLPSPQISLDAGDYAPLQNWLRDNIWQHGRRYGRDELLVRATGRQLDAEPYIKYLAQKYLPAGQQCQA